MFFFSRDSHVSPAVREKPRTGISAIDTMNSVVRGQKLPLFSVPQLNGKGKVGQGWFSIWVYYGFTMWKVTICGVYYAFTMVLLGFYYTYYGFTMVLLKINIDVENHDVSYVILQTKWARFHSVSLNTPRLPPYVPTHE
jgi:hypothetical protein